MIKSFVKIPARLRAASRSLSTARPFPSLIISSGGLEANGVFAESQVAFLEPDSGDVSELDARLHQTHTGIVSHYYMDPELQGILSSLEWPHVFTADSLAMGDAAVGMAERGVSSIVCLGVDFMAESVRSTLDSQGFAHVPVYRVSDKHIGCSLAESAESDAYAAWLAKAAATPKSLHVVYINTSMVTKAKAQSAVPTITCTSSNVVQTILQAYAQIPGLTVWYGPDTYMGENLRHLLESLLELPDSEIKKLHPEHSRATVEDALTRFQVFQQGNCVVHHMFGGAVAEQVQKGYPEAFHTAHLEVPGDMFAIANEAAQRGRGVVGSTSNILDFILSKANEAAHKEVSGDGAGPGHADNQLTFILGTEAGMITPIVRRVREIIAGTKLRVEIVFPVSAEAITVTGEDPSTGLAVVPTGQGNCSGCATCPYMKMNSFDSLMDVLGMLEEKPESLSLHAPARRGPLPNGNSVAEVGGIPIRHMRAFSHEKVLPGALVEDILQR